MNKRVKQVTKVLITLNVWFELMYELNGYELAHYECVNEM